MLRKVVGLALNHPPVLIWITAALFTVFQLLLEMVTNTMTDSLASSFKINHTQIGLLSSAFFYTFLSMQLPAGIILDRFDIRKTLSLTCLGCSIGCLLFAAAPNFTCAIVARLVMGAFAAFGFLGLLKVSAMWFHPKLFPFLLGLSQFSVMMTTSFCEPIFARYVLLLGWQNILIIIGFTGFVISILIALFVKQKTTLITVCSASITNSLKYVLSTMDFWLSSIYGFGMFSIITTFSALWGLSFLKHVYHFSVHASAISISMSFTGTAFGCAVFGYLASRNNNGLHYMRICSLLSLPLIIFLAACQSLPTYTAEIILFLLGFLCGAFFLCFDVVKRSVPMNMGGIAISLCNIIIMCSTILLQPIMGLIIDGSRKYQSSSFLTTVDGYRLSLVILFVSVFIAFISSYLIKGGKTHFASVQS